MKVNVTSPKNLILASIEISYLMNYINTNM